MDINPTFNYKNAEIEIVVEDDVITTCHNGWRVCQCGRHHR